MGNTHDATILAPLYWTAFHLIRWATIYMKVLLTFP